MLACRRFDDIFDYRREFLLKLNDLWTFKLLQNAPLTGEIITPYIAADSHHLTPIHLVTRDSQNKPFTLYKGLILFHLTIHDRNINFKYPKPGSFYGTTPAHSLHILFEERLSDVTHKKIVRLITYQLKSDLIVTDNAGDNIDCSDYLYDGVVGGFYSKVDFGVDAGFNEIRICKGPTEDLIEFIEEIEITLPTINKLKIAHLSNIGNIFNETIRTRICPTKELLWSVVSNGYGLMYLYEFLKGKMIDDDRLLLFNSKANIYVSGNNMSYPNINTSVVITIPYGQSLYAKIWTKKLSEVWPLLNLMLTTIVNLRSDYLEFFHYKDLILDDSVIQKLKSQGIDISNFT